MTTLQNALLTELSSLPAGIRALHLDFSVSTRFEGTRKQLRSAIIILLELDNHVLTNGIIATLPNLKLLELDFIPGRCACWAGWDEEGNKAWRQLDDRENLVIPEHLS